MAFSSNFISKLKSFQASLIYVGAARIRVPKPNRFNLWIAPSGDGMNLPTFVYDPDVKVWQRSPKVIVSTTDPASSAALIVSNDVRANDLWVNPSANYGLNGGSRTQVYTGGTPTAEVQSLVATGATAGTFTLTFKGFTTGTIAWNASAATVVAALVALPSIGAGGVTASGGALPTTPVVITFAAGLATGPQPLLVPNSAALTTAPAVVTESTQGVAAWQ